MIPHPDFEDATNSSKVAPKSIAELDYRAGQILDTLEELGLTDNTIVVFVADHGDNLGSHGMFNKGELIEEAVRVPLIFSVPTRIDPCVNRGQVAQTIDVMPSLLDIACIGNPGDHLQGRNLAPIIRGERETLDENFAVIETMGQLGLRTPQNLYGTGFNEELRTPQTTNICLFDLSTDPYEFNNLAGTPAVAEREATMHQQLMDWDCSTAWLS